MALGITFLAATLGSVVAPFTGALVSAFLNETVLLQIKIRGS